MFRRFQFQYRRVRLYLAIVLWLTLACLIAELRYISQVSTAVAMDMKATSLSEEILRCVQDTSATGKKTTLPRSTPPKRGAPLYLYVILSLSQQEVEQPIEAKQALLPSVLHFYEIRTIAGVDLPGYAVSAVWKKVSQDSFWIPAPYFHLSAASVNTSSRRISLTTMSYQGDIFAANVGFLSPAFGKFGGVGSLHPRFIKFAGWSPSLVGSLHRVEVSMPHEHKDYRWGAFSPPPTYGRISFCPDRVKAFALYRNREEAQKAVLRLWDTNGRIETVQGTNIALSVDTGK